VASQDSNGSIGSSSSSSSSSRVDDLACATGRQLAKSESFSFLVLLSFRLSLKVPLTFRDGLPSRVKFIEKVAGSTFNERPTSRGYTGWKKNINNRAERTQKITNCRLGALSGCQNAWAWLSKCPLGGH